MQFIRSFPGLLPDLFQFRHNSHHLRVCSARGAQQVGLPYIVIASRHGLIATAAAEVVLFHLVERQDSVESAKRRVGGQGRARQSILVCKMVSRVGSAHGCFEFCSNYYKNSENTHKKKIQASRQFCLKLGRKTWRLLNSAKISERANNTTSIWLLFC